MVSVDPLTLRSYQTQLLQNVFSAFAQGQRRVFLQLPTGGGKTHCFSHLAKEFLNQQQGVLVVAHRQELIEQAHDKLTAISGLPAAKLTAGKKVNPAYQIRDDTPTYLQIIRKEKTPFSLLHHGTIAIGSEVFEMTLMHSRQQFEPELVIGSRQSPE